MIILQTNLLNLDTIKRPQSLIDAEKYFVSTFNFPSITRFISFDHAKFFILQTHFYLLLVIPEWFNLLESNFKCLANTWKLNCVLEIAA